jgi:hypothetical protein
VGHQGVTSTIGFAWCECERIGVGLVDFEDDHFSKQKGCSPFA